MPTVVVFEVYKKVKARLGDEVALEAIATLSQYQVVDLTREVTLLAADLSIEYKLAMADSFVLAHAHHLQSDLLTLDNDFAGVRGARVIRK